MKRLGWYIFIWVALLGCVRDLPDGKSEEDGSYPNDAKVSITFSVPDQHVTPSTKALANTARLDSLHVAVFGSSGYLKEYVKATIHSSSYSVSEETKDTTFTYSCTVELTPSEKPRILHFIGNGPSTLPFADTTVIASLMSERGGQAFWQMTRMERIGTGSYNETTKKYTPDDYTSGKLSVIPLVRNWAKISILAESSSHFQPFSFAVVNKPSKGTVAPSYIDEHGVRKFVEGYETLSFSELEAYGYPASLPDDAILDPTIPSADSFENPSENNGVVAYDEGKGVAFLFERPMPNTIEPTFVIVYGHYTPEGEDQSLAGDYYYKLDLSQGDQYYPVYRNFQYQIKITNIESIGHNTPAEAANSAGSADVSTDPAITHLPEISDGEARLAIQPWMAKNFTSKVDGEQVLFVKFFDDVNNIRPNMEYSPETLSQVYDEAHPESCDAVTYQILPMGDGSPDLIRKVELGAPSKPDADDSDTEKGWRPITLWTSGPAETPRSQTLRVVGQYTREIVSTSSTTLSHKRLYRDIVITLLPFQQMVLACDNPLANATGAQQTLNISIPDGLDQSMFPLDFYIEPEDLTLTPDKTEADNNLPVVTGKLSISGSGKTTYQFLRTVTWEEYGQLPTWFDADDHIWRRFHCHFVSTRSENATTIWVANTYFRTASIAFTNGLKTFANFGFTSSIPRAVNADVTASFEVEKSYKFGYPTLLLSVKGLTPQSTDDITFTERPDLGDPSEGITTWQYTPSSSTQTLSFKTAVSDGAVSLSLIDTQDQYERASIHSYYFHDFGFVDGHAMQTPGKYSNVVSGHINSGNGKSVLFGYCDDESDPGYAANVQFKGLNMNYLSHLPITKLPYSPQGPRSAEGDPKYHEIDLNTPTSSTDAISFKLAADGYVEEFIKVGRFSNPNGSISNWDFSKIINKGNVLKDENSFGFTADNPSFYFQADQWAKISFNAGNDDISFNENGVVLKQRNTPYELCFTSQTKSGNTYSNNTVWKLFYMQITFSAGHHPSSGSQTNGTFTQYKGSANEYLWLIPIATTSYPDNLTPKLNLYATDKDIVIESIAFKTFNGTFSSY